MAPDKSTIPRSMSLQTQGISTDQTQGTNGNGVNGNSRSSSGFGRNQNNKNCDLKPVKELSDMLATGLTEEQLALCVQLIHDGIPPRMLAEFVKRSREYR